MGVPIVSSFRLFEHVIKITGCLGLKEFVQSLHQVILIDANETPIVC